MPRLPAGLLVVAAAAVAAAASTAVRCDASPPFDGLTLRVTTVRGGVEQVAADGDPVGATVDQVFVHGAADRACQLIVVATHDTGAPVRILPAGPSDQGDLVGPGAFRLPGSIGFEPLGSPLRLVAACGGPELRTEALVRQVFQARLAAGGVARMRPLEGLPPGTMQASRLFRTMP